MEKNKKNRKAAETVKNIAIGILIGFLFASLTAFICRTEEKEENPFSDKLLVIDTNDYTTNEIWDIIENRKGKIVVVIEHGIVENLNGDGSGNLGYIKYCGYKPGTKVDTYFIYNPGTNYWDDITERFDFAEE